MTIVFFNRKNYDLKEKAETYYYLFHDFIAHTIGAFTPYFDIGTDIKELEILENNLHGKFDRVMNEVIEIMEETKMRKEIYSLLLEMKKESNFVWRKNKDKCNSFLVKCWESVDVLRNLMKAEGSS